MKRDQQIVHGTNNNGFGWGNVNEWVMIENEMWDAYVREILFPLRHTLLLIYILFAFR